MTSHGSARNPYYEALGGVRIKRETVATGGTELVEIAYGWSDIAPLTTGS